MNPRYGWEGFHPQLVKMQLNVKIWKYSPLKLRGASKIVVNVAPVNKPPIARLYEGIVTENTDEGHRSCYPYCGQRGYGLSSIRATDPDGDDSEITYEIIGGNQENAFRIDGEGIIRIQNKSALNYENNPFFALRVAVSDQHGAVAHIVAALRQQDQNDLPRWCESECPPLGICRPLRPKAHQPLESIIVRRINENAKVGKHALDGSCVDAPNQKPNLNMPHHAEHFVRWMMINFLVLNLSTSNWLGGRAYVVRIKKTNIKLMRSSVLTFAAVLSCLLFLGK